MTLPHETMIFRPCGKKGIEADIHMDRLAGLNPTYGQDTPANQPVASVRIGPMQLLALCCLAVVVLAGCATVHPEDQAAWVGAPVAALDTQPIFLTMPVVKTVAADGTEIRNYVNARDISSCSGGGAIFSGSISVAAYNSFAHCMRRQAACNNIFYIKNGTVTAFTPIGSGGMRCYTDARVRPGFRGATNYQ